MSETVSLRINNKIYVVNSGITLIQACSNVGVDIPRFCFHEKLSIAGNCRMCLVEISRPKSLKPAASCALPISNGMFIHTNTIMVKRARESVLEFLLLNHPLDCPICDQGGECDLQDQTIVFGSDRGRFYDGKRATVDKECGPLIKTVMTRCIHCTRCVRFGNEIAGVDFLGTTGRGYFTEIGSYINKMLFSELSGNIIDLCPVGALTSKPYAFMARSWELRSIETIDVMDSIGSNIRVDLRGLNVLRILPRLNENLNEEWITDKTRFFYDGLNLRRVQMPLIRFGSRLIPVSWDAVFIWIGFQLYFKKIDTFFGVIGKLADAESIFCLKLFLNKLGNANFFVENVHQMSIDFRYTYLLNVSLVELENIDFCLLVAFNPRLELPLLNLRLRKAVKTGLCSIFSFGYNSNLTYKVVHLSNKVNNFLRFVEGKSTLCRLFLKSKKTLILLGNSLLERFDGYCYIELVPVFMRKIFKDKLNVFFCSMVLNDVGLLNSFELGLNINSDVKNFSLYKKSNSLLYMLGSTDLRFLCKSTSFLNNSLKIYQGHTGSRHVDIADIILPSTTFLESTGYFLNLEGRVQSSFFVNTPPGLARTNWKIIVMLSSFLRIPIEIKSLAQIRGKLKVYSPIFNHEFLLFNKNFIHVYFQLLDKLFVSNKFYLSAHPFVSPFFNFFFTNVLSSSSKILNLVSKQFVKKKNFNNL